jgi:hypothetical protein
VPETSPPPAQSPPIRLKDPAIAGFLAWLVPGLGHLYQGRNAKAGLFFVCILGTFLYGLSLGSKEEIGWGRVVYFSFRQGVKQTNGQRLYENDLRLHYLFQVGAGLLAMPALIQAAWDPTGEHPLLGRFMAPPKLEMNDQGQLVAKELYKQAPRLFDLGTTYTMIAGLLNILAIYDACCGPVPLELPKRKEDDDEKEKKKDTAAAEDGQ